MEKHDCCKTSSTPAALVDVHPAATAVTEADAKRCGNSAEIKEQNPKPSPAPILHFVVIGGGSAAHASATRAHALGAQVTVINDGLPQGGCCVNVGCVPSKMLIRAAESVHRVQTATAAFDGLERKTAAGGTLVKDFGKLIRQKRQLVAGLRQAKVVT